MFKRWCQPVNFSLIVCSVDRTVELHRLLESLSRQTLASFEVIVVDQNGDDRLESILRQFRTKLKIIHLRRKRGLSYCRNEGLDVADGEVVAFPDDDCWYRPDLLKSITACFKTRREIDGLTGRGVAENGRPVGRYAARAGWVDARNVWIQATSYTIFLRREVVHSVGGFDVTLGLGSRTPWCAAEEHDYLLRALALGHRIWYDPALVVFHPDRPKAGAPITLARTYGYGRATGSVLRAHRRPIYEIAWHLLRPLGGALLAGGIGRFGTANYYMHSLAGRWRGWRDSPRSAMRIEQEK